MKHVKLIDTNCCSMPLHMIDRILHVHEKRLSGLIRCYRDSRFDYWNVCTNCTKPVFVVEEAPKEDAELGWKEVLLIVAIPLTIVGGMVLWF